MSTVQEIESAIRNLPLQDMRQIHEWLEDIMEDQLPLTDEFTAKIVQSEKEMTAGLRPRVR
jgi:hypothetical protein